MSLIRTVAVWVLAILEVAVFGLLLTTLGG